MGAPNDDRLTSPLSVRLFAINARRWIFHKALSREQTSSDICGRVERGIRNRHSRDSQNRGSLGHELRRPFPQMEHARRGKNHAATNVDPFSGIGIKAVYEVRKRTLDRVLAAVPPESKRG